MSLRKFSNINKLLAVPAFVCGVGVSAFVSSAALAAGSATSIIPPVQTYADPSNAPGDYYESPLSAGTLTLQDVLEAHPSSSPASKLPAITGSPSATATAPILTPPVQSSSTGLMLSQGMRAVLQKVGDTAVKPPVIAPASSANPLLTVSIPVPQTTAQSQAQGQPASLVAAAAPALASPPPTAAVVNGVTYEPGQAPRNLANLNAPVAAVATAAPVAAPAPVAAAAPQAALGTLPVAAEASAKACDENVQKWEKSCSEAGYPSNYVGKIVGETRTGCADGALHDVWVTNSCAPPDTTAAQAPKTDGVCGAASNNEFDDAPAANLCGQGTASSVSGDGPWTWACSGINGGDAAACIARKRVPATNGACGAANGVAAEAAPSADLCNAGNATIVKGTGPWTWSCKGTGKGSSESCIAPVFVPPAPAAAVEPTPAPVHTQPPAVKNEAVSAKAQKAKAAAEKAAPAAPAVPVEAAPAEPAPVAAPAETSSEKSELCGTAAETLAYEAPENDLCRAGTASVVNGSGPWTWSCTNNEGVTSTCTTLSLNGEASAPAAEAEPAVPKAAPQAAVSTSSSNAGPRVQNSGSSVPFAAEVPAAPELACGLAASQAALQPPTTELCDGGKATTVRGSGPWRWTCIKGHHKIACETPKVLDGACGAANGAALRSAPFAGLCSSGTPSGIEGDGPWKWVCKGNGAGVDVSCAASVQGKPNAVDGSCGTASGSNLKEIPVDGLCSSGTPSAVSGEGPWTWSCSGTNGGAVGSCSANKIVPPKPPGPTVNGLCGSASGMTMTTQPTDNLCASGTISGVVGNGPWNWSCIGENGGMTVSCTAPLEPPAPIDGACGAANGVATLVLPESSLCSSGLTGNVKGKGPWTWTCSGANGGDAASCVAPLAGKSGGVPSIMTSAGTDSPAPVSGKIAPTSLVTPHLPPAPKLPALDSQALPRLTPSKSFASLPTPSQVPAATDLTQDAVPQTPSLPDGSDPLQPPSLRDALPSAPVLHEGVTHPSHIPGNHLTLESSLSTVLFTRGSGNIDGDIIMTLDKVATILQDNPDVRISLIAYADNTGSTPRDARRLSLTRALAVRDYLASKNVSESRVDVHAEGANTHKGNMDRVDIQVN